MRTNYNLYEYEDSLHKEGYKYLLCSDGVTDMLSDTEIEEILSREL